MQLVSKFSMQPDTDVWAQDASAGG